jgi:hypothetical protein
LVSERNPGPEAGRRGDCIPSGVPGARCYDGDVTRDIVRTTVAAIAALLLVSPALYAQTDSTIAVGAALTFYDPANANAHHPTGFGLVGRLRRGSGLGVTVGMDWFTSDLRAEVEGQPTPIGHMSIRPLMAGVSYIRQYHHYAVSAGIVGGWSFNSLSQSNPERLAYGYSIGTPVASVSISNCLAVEPNVTFWRELGRHFAASASVAYMVARPTLTARGPIGTRADTINLSATVVTFALVYGVF